MLRRLRTALSQMIAPTNHASESYGDWNAWDGCWGVESSSGEPVNHKRALRYAPFWQAVSMISGDVAILTPHVQKRTEDMYREVDTEHPAEFLISSQANEHQTAIVVMRRWIAHALMYPHGFIYIERNNVNEPTALYNLLPDRTCIRKSKDGVQWVTTEVDGQLVPLDAANVLCLSGLSMDKHGCDLVKHARDTIGLGLAAEGFSSRFFAKGANASGVLEIPNTMTPQSAVKLSDDFMKKFTGRDNWFRVMVLRDGAKFHATMVDAQKAQLSQLREDQVRDVCRFFNLPPWKLGLQDSQSYNSAEAAQRVYLQSALVHWLEPAAEEMSMKLLRPSEWKDKSRRVVHNTKKLLMTSQQELTATIVQQRNAGLITANEGRAALGYGPSTDPSADVLYNPNTTSGNPALTSDAENMASANRLVLASAVGRMARRISNRAQKHASNPDGFLAWLDESLADEVAIVAETMAPAVGVVAAQGGADGRRLAGVYAVQLVERFRDRLSTLVESVSDRQLAPAVTEATAALTTEVVTDLVPLIIEECNHAEERTETRLLTGAA